MLTLAEIVEIGVVGVTIALLRGYFGNKRTKALDAVVSRMGFVSEGDDWKRDNSAPQLETALFARGVDGRIVNIITGRNASLDCSFFDYGYGVRRGSVHQTVAAFSGNFCFPQFEIAPKNIVRRLSNAVLHKEIQFDSDPGFSERLGLRGPDEERVREMFAARLRSFLHGLDPQTPFTIEGCGRSLIIYQRGRKIDPEEFPAFVRETTDMARIFFNSCGPK